MEEGIPNRPAGSAGFTAAELNPVPPVNDGDPVPNIEGWVVGVAVTPNKGVAEELVRLVDAPKTGAAVVAAVELDPPNNGAVVFEVPNKGVVVVPTAPNS